MDSFPPSLPAGESETNKQTEEQQHTERPNERRKYQRTNRRASRTTAACNSRSIHMTGEWAVKEERRAASLSALRSQSRLAVSSASLLSLKTISTHFYHHSASAIPSSFAASFARQHSLY
mmetsp:Transcript_1174/g.3989  ORF Transcript_1174/g.3989 Transcript_1174/m.3989 type:complete len:120 (-) Transcript_1174:263-622(-)